MKMKPATTLLYVALVALLLAPLSLASLDSDFMSPMDDQETWDSAFNAVALEEDAILAAPAAPAPVTPAASSTDCDAINMNLPASVASVTCSLSAQTKKQLVQGATCLDDAALTTSASRPWRAGFGSCGTASTQFLYDSSRNYLFAGDSMVPNPDSKRFLRVCSLRVPGTVLPTNYVLTGMNDCSVGSYNLKTKCVGDTCPADDVAFFASSDDKTNQFVFETTGQRGVFRIKSVATGQCVKYYSAGANNTLINIGLDSCFDDSSSASATTGNSFTIGLNVQRRCEVKCAFGYAPDPTVVNTNGFSAKNAGELLTCSAGNASWTFNKDPCSACAPGFVKVDGVCKLPTRARQPITLTAFTGGSCSGSAVTSASVLNRQCVQLPNTTWSKYLSTDLSAIASCSGNTPSSRWSLRVFRNNNCTGIPVAYREGNNDNCTRPLRYTSQQLTLRVSCANPVDRDCSVSDWSAWSSCDAACGNGFTYRTRVALVTPYGNGAACPPLREVRPCYGQACVVNCRVSEWGPWTPCSQSCGVGTTYRERRVLQASANGGAACPSLIETRSCSNNVTVCPVDCQLSPWTQWSNCSVSCGGGVRSRTRAIVTPAAGWGRRCPTNPARLLQTEPCNLQGCPVDCVASAPTAFSNCTQPCGGGFRTAKRTVTVDESNGGKACPSLRVEEPCNVDACPAGKCNLSPWGNWSACSASCGGGNQTRTRTRTGDWKTCGTSWEHRECNTQPCPVDCQVGSWTNFTNCTARCDGGTSFRTRRVLVAPRNGGAACPALFESVVCNTSPCAVSCQVGAWGNFSTCSASCGGGLMVRRRPVLVPASNGGSPCPKLEQTVPCNDIPCISDCRVGPWSNYSECSRPCGGGESVRTRQILHWPTNGGRACPTDLSESLACNTHSCPMDCVVGDWSQWSPCSATCGGTSFRARSIISRQRNGGKVCPELRQERVCKAAPCPISGQVGPFGTWSNCSEPCGTGFQTRKRNVTVISVNTATPYPALAEEQPCNTQACDANKCAASAWTAWSSCSATCGVGVQTRTRTAVKPDLWSVSECGRLQEKRRCNRQPCPINCVTTSYGPWSACSAVCGGGLRSRNRTILTNGQHGGEACPDLVEVETCNEQACDRDCFLSDWEWSSTCSKSCGGGTRTRARRVLVTPAGRGVACPALTETVNCNTHACPSASCRISPWSEWSNCSVACGGGQMNRSRTVLNAAEQPEDCPAVSMTAPCNTHPCAVNCQVSAWSEWSTCSASCSGGFQTRTRSIVVNEANGGALCPHLEETRSCKTRACGEYQCQLSPWSNFSACSASCAGGVSVSTRQFIALPAFVALESAPGQCDSRVSDGVLELGRNSTVSFSRTGAAPLNGFTLSFWMQIDLRQCDSLSRRTGLPRGGCTFLRVTGTNTMLALRFNTTLNKLQVTLNNQPPLLAAITLESMQQGFAHYALVHTPVSNGVRRQLWRNGVPVVSDTILPTTVAFDTVWIGGHRRNPANATFDQVRLFDSAVPNVDIISTLFRLAWDPAAYNTVPAKAILDLPIKANSASAVDVASSPSTWTAASTGTPKVKRCFAPKAPEGFVRGFPLKFTGTAAISSFATDLPASNNFTWSLVNFTLTDKAWSGLGHKNNSVSLTILTPEHAGKSVARVHTLISLVRGVKGQTLATVQFTAGDNTVVTAVLRAGENVRTAKVFSDGSVNELADFQGTSPNNAQPAFRSGSGLSVLDLQTFNLPAAFQSSGLKQVVITDSGNDNTQRIIVFGITAERFRVNRCGSLTRTSTCNTQPCGEPQSCIMGNWTAWSACSASCGSGFSERRRNIVRPPMFGGARCGVQRQFVGCEVPVACPVACEVSDWSAWSECSVSCGSGVRARTRSVVTTPLNRGAACPHLREEQTCSARPCSQDCKVGNWSAFLPCTNVCGGGLTNRSRPILSLPQYDGNSCPVLNQTLQCNLQPCPIDCKLSDWSAWSACSKSCGGDGVQTRTKTVLVAPLYGGLECDPLRHDQRRCAFDPCPMVSTSPQVTVTSSGQRVLTASVGSANSLGEERKSQVAVTLPAKETETVATVQGSRNVSSVTIVQHASGATSMTAQPAGKDLPPPFSDDEKLVGPRGPYGPKGDTGPKGDKGDAGKPVPPELLKKYRRALRVLSDSLFKMKQQNKALDELENQAYPIWVVSPYSCPDNWTRLRYSVREDRVYCKPPTNPRLAPGNAACNSIASFPELYDRCGWTKHCQATWTKFGCYNKAPKPTAAPAPTTTAAPKRALLEVSDDWQPSPFSSFVPPTMPAAPVAPAPFHPPQ